MKKEKIYIIWRHNKWAVRKSKSKRALKLFKHRELAFKYACDIQQYMGENIISINNKDGSPAFQYDLIRDKIL